MAENGRKDSHELGTEDVHRTSLTQYVETELEFGDEVSDEKYAKLALEVAELAMKVAEYREKAPKELAVLLESSLSAFRKLPVVESLPADSSAQEEDNISELVQVVDQSRQAQEEDNISELAAERVRLNKRLEVAISSLPEVLQEFKDTISRLDNLIEIANQQRDDKSYSSSVVKEEKGDHIQEEMGKSGVRSLERIVSLSSAFSSV